jgi:hypothetical protein
MSSTPNFPERSHNPAQSGGDGLYDPAAVEQESSLTVSVQDQLDNASRRSLEAVQRSASSIFDYVRRNPVRVAIGVAGVAALLAAWSRRSSRY